MGPGASSGGGPMMAGPGGAGMSGAPPGGYLGQQGFGEPSKGYVNPGLYSRSGGGYAGGPGGYAGRWVLASSCSQRHLLVHTQPQAHHL